MGGAALIPQGVKEEAAEVAQKTFLSMKTEFGKSPAGQNLLKIVKEDFEPTFAKVKQNLTSGYQAAGGQYPAAKISNEAKNIARQTAFGRNDSIIAHAIVWAQHTNGTVHAQNLADHMAMYMQDTVHWDKLGTDVSSVKANVKFNKQYKDFTQDLNINPVYKPHTKLESSLQHYASTILAPLIAIPHLGTPLNMAISTPLSDLARGLAQVIKPGGYAATKQALLDTGIFADNSLQAYRELQQYRSGFIAQKTGSPGLGVILGKAIHQPGFNALRDWTLAFSGATGKLSAERFASDFAKTGSTRAKIELQQMGLDPVAIARQGGQLTQEQLEKAIYHFVDNKIFLNTRLNRSFYSQSSPLMRTALMFHNYVSSQGQLLRREMYKAAVQAKDPMLAVQTLAVLGVAFPVAGTLISSLENFARGNWDTDNLDEKMQNLSFKNGFTDGALQYLDAYAHMAGFGVATSYVRGATRNELSNSIIGPIGNVAVRDLQDVASTGMRLAEGKDATSPEKQLARDVAEQTLPDNLGKIVAHRFIPTKAEEKARGGGKLNFRRKSGFKGLKRLGQ